MTKKDWQILYKDLLSRYGKFSIHYSKFQNGKNETVRQDAKFEMESEMRYITRIVKDNQKLSAVIEKGTDEFSRFIVFDEFKDPQYFEFDMKEILQKIKSLIDD